MLTKWSPRHAAAVRTRIESILGRPDVHPDSTVEAARRSGGLPVYGDLGGTIALTPDGDFVLVDHDSGSVVPLADGRWADVALAAAGRHYPELRDLAPDRLQGG